jgi:voltage-gated potassium channel
MAASRRPTQPNAAQIRIKAKREPANAPGRRPPSPAQSSRASRTDTASGACPATAKRKGRTMIEDKRRAAMIQADAPPRSEPLRRRIFYIVFEADTPAGRAFDVGLILSIVISVAVVMLDSMREVRMAYGDLLYGIEWFFTIMFTIEYALRLFCTARPARYATSFFGIIDLLAILPTYISLLVPGSQYLLVIRVLRVLRVFRVLRIVQYLGEANLLSQALWASRRKIFVFLFGVVTLIIVLGSMMYMIEGEQNGFTSIPVSIYWAVVTLTTVGFGDITPRTPLGQMLAACIMIIGYSIIAVPTGIVTVEMSNLARGQSARICSSCGKSGHEPDARFCKHCGTSIT